MPDIHTRLPDLDSSQLIFDERETRAILLFFWPYHREKLNELPSIDDEFRKLAQGLLIVAIDSSFAMGFVNILFDVLRSGGRPSFPGLANMGRKLAGRYVAHWWKHTRQQDLYAVKIYETVREVIAGNFKPVIYMMLAERTSANAPSMFAKFWRTPFLIRSLRGDRSYWC